MALMITEECVTCGDCEPGCPNNAISEGSRSYIIDTDKCTECVGYFDAPLCVDICPVHCIVKNPDCIESRDQLKTKHLELSNK